ncbi:MAG: endonuclease III domain-containing protein [Thermodesulfobacteriota bacterium]
MTAIKEKIHKIFNSLSEYYGPQNWWPADDAFECMVGAILTQNTSWSNVELALNNIKSKMSLNIRNISQIQLDDLSRLIKPAGYYNQKALRLKEFVEFINNKFDGRLENMLPVNENELRKQLLSVKGIGPETADSILLYALNKPVFVIDKYTYRIFYRHGIIPKNSSYELMQKIFMNNLAENVQLFNEYHALIVMLGKNHCGKKAKCNKCPLDIDPHHFSDEII